MVLPKGLVDNVREGRAFLFLGAGASFGSIHPKYKNPPNGQALADELAKKFLGSEYIGLSLAQVSELAINEHDLFTVQEYVASIYRDFEPSDFHLLIPKFSWLGIATTNYDLIIEKAYSKAKDPIQTPVVFMRDGERIDEKLRSKRNILYLKLHGCVTCINDANLPLILTPEQYIDHKRNRKRLFEKFQGVAYENPFIVVGHSLSDIDIRAVLHEIDSLQDAKPRSYIVTPNMTLAETKFWESKKFTLIQMSFKDFLEELDKSIPAHFRELSILTDKKEIPIMKRMSIPNGIGLSESLIKLITRDTDYLSSEFKTEQPNPQAFYKGYFVDWSPITGNLDVERSITETMLSEIFLPDESEKREKCELVILKGHAGSGKSVILKRLAWEASVNFEKLCLFAKQGSIIDYEPISDLYRLCKERIYLFLDPVTEFSEIIEDLITKARKDNIPLSIICAERYNEWNELCIHLERYIGSIYNLTYLNDKEIEGLIELLRVNKSLGYLQDKSLEEQKDELGKRAGRQILVALHEATLGKPFTDIVFDEFNSIRSLRAKSLYLTVCIFHRLNVPIRAGLIARIHNIPFLEFKEKLFLPLENIVFTQMNEKIRDFEFRSRHSHIAEIVFERVLTQPQDRFDEYMRIINAIDVDYYSDQEAFKGITNARELLRLFRDPDMIRQIYASALDRDDDNPMLLQQNAIFEMNSPGGNLSKANELLVKANKQAPYLKPIIHSLSELARKKADKTDNLLEKQKYISQSKKLSQDLIAGGNSSAHPYITLIKLELEELEELITSEMDEVSIGKKTKEIESLISTTLQYFPDDAHVRDSESRFCDLINQHDRALKALEKAFSINKRNSFIASRLAKVYQSIGEEDKAVNTLSECLDANQNDKLINFQLATFLEKKADHNRSEIRHLLRRSFTDGDNNYIAQFWYARHIYIDGDIEESLRIFQRLGNLNVDSNIKHLPRGVILENNIAKKFSGSVLNVETSYAYVIRDGLQDKIYAYAGQTEPSEWNLLRYHRRVNFNMGFNYYGPIIINIKNEI